MLKKTACILSLTCSFRLLALSTSDITTLSDEEEDIWGTTLLLNDKAEAAVAWVNATGPKAHIEISFQLDNQWQAVQVASPSLKDLYNPQAELDEVGNIAVAWNYKSPDHTTFHYLTHKNRAEENWSHPVELGEMLNNPQTVDYKHYDTRFIGEGRLCLVEAEDSKGIHGIIYLPQDKTTHSFQLSREQTLQKDYTHFDSISIHTQKNDLPYLLWEVRNYGQGPATQLWGCPVNSLEPEKICSFKGDYISTGPEVSMGPKGQMAIAWIERTSGYNNHGESYAFLRVILKDEHGWSEPIDLSVPAEDADNPQLSLDAQGNLMVVWEVTVDDIFFIKAVYKPAGGPWREPVTFQSPSGIYWFPQVQKDQADHFVMIWQEEVRKRQTILGATFSTQEETWTQPTLLSPEGQSSWDPRFLFETSQGKGLIAWTATRNGFEEAVQVARLHSD